MNLQSLASGLDLSDRVLTDIAALLETKRTARETGTGPRLATIDDLIRGEFDAAQSLQPASGESHDLHDEAEALFRRIVKAQSTSEGAA